MSFLTRLFRPEPDPREALRPLWSTVVALARDPRWYAQAGVEDTVEGRFDMVTAVLSLVLIRLERDPAAAGAATLLTELFVEDMDGQLREFGVGDVVVGKHVGKLMSMLGGRLGAYRDALSGDDAALTAAVARNTRMSASGSPDAVAKGLRALAARLAATGDADLLEGRIAP
jgi:cytochrome b pre-mRNA-processing protein 3